MNYTDIKRRQMYDTQADKNILAMAFVNVQQFNSVYDVETGFGNGTIFPCLDKPLMIRRMPR